MKKLFYGHIVNKGVKIHYYRTGDEKPTILLIHGITDNGLCWSRLALQLEPDYDVVMVDVRGHGMSDAPGYGYSQKSLASDISILIKDLKLDHPIVVGHSMGAQIAAVTAIENQDLVRALILEDPPWRVFEEDTEPIRSKIVQDYLVKLRKYQTNNLMELIELNKTIYPAWMEEERLQWAKAKLLTKPEVFNFFLEDWINWSDYLTKLTCPTLLIISDIDSGGIVTSTIAWEAKSKSQGLFDISQIQGASHQIHRTEFEIFYSVLMSFLSNLRQHENKPGKISQYLKKKFSEW